MNRSKVESVKRKYKSNICLRNPHTVLIMSYLMALEMLCNTNSTFLSTCCRETYFLKEESFAIY